MADLTVLSTVTHLPPHPSLFRTGYSPRASTSRLSLIRANSPVPHKPRPKLSQLDLTARQKEKSTAESDDSDSQSSASTPTSQVVESPEATQQTQEIAIVSPTPILGKRPTHKYTRSQSAPPERIYFTNDDNESTTPRSNTHSGTLYASSANLAGQFSPLSKTRANRGFSTYSMNSPQGSFGQRSPAPGEPIKPPPPLHRPTTFWRRNPRSGVTSSSYSPSTHLIRRSTFIAAGLPFDKPMYDVSALGVESRIVHDAVSGKVTETFWEVIEAR